MILIIVESPAKCKKIESFLGAGYMCKASNGHIRDLKKNKMSIDIENNFTPDYAVLADKKKVIADLRKAKKKADEVIIASDLDREGEAIGYHIIKVLGLNLAKTKRIVFNSITKKAILEAVKNPKKLDTNLVAAQQARRVLDRLVGFTLSPILWSHFETKSCLSAGRCQTVALRLICDREKEITSFNSKSFYNVYGVFKPSKKDKSKDKSLDYTLSGKLLNSFDKQEYAVDFLKKCYKATFSIDKISSKRSETQPPRPFITSTLQQTASYTLGFAPKTTMSVAQKLYEKGYITYMRTDSVALSIDFLYEVKKLIYSSAKLGSQYYKKRMYQNKSSNAQEAHEAIRPTSVNKGTDHLSTMERKLYDLIWKRAIASQMKSQVKQIYTYHIKLSNSDEKFIASIDKELFPGFTILTKGKVEDITEDKIEQDENKDYERDYGKNSMKTLTNEQIDAIVDSIKKGDIFDYTNISAEEKWSKGKSHYSEALLIKDLEKKGIGRPSTFSNIVTTILTRKYALIESRNGVNKTVSTFTLKEKSKKIEHSSKTIKTQKETKRIFPTDLGMQVCTYLTDKFSDIFDYKFTATVETYLDKIAEGKLVWYKAVQNVYDSFSSIAKKEKSSLAKSGKKKRNPFKLDLSNKRLIGKYKKYPVYSYIGAHGPVLVWVKGPNKKDCSYTAIPVGISYETISLDDAKDLLKFPKELGSYEGKPVYVNISRYGYYVKYDGKNFSIKNDDTDITLETAIESIVKKSRSIIKEFKDMTIRIGKFGPYILYNSQFYSIPESITDLKNLKKVDCMKIIEKDKKRKGYRKRGKRKNTKKLH